MTARIIASRYCAAGRSGEPITVLRNNQDSVGAVSLRHGKAHPVNLDTISIIHILLFEFDGCAFVIVIKERELIECRGLGINSPEPQDDQESSQMNVVGNPHKHSPAVAQVSPQIFKPPHAASVAAAPVGPSSICSAYQPPPVGVCVIRRRQDQLDRLRKPLPPHAPPYLRAYDSIKLLSHSGSLGSERIFNPLAIIQRRSQESPCLVCAVGSRYAGSLRASSSEMKP